MGSMSSDRQSDVEIEKSRFETGGAGLLELGWRPGSQCCNMANPSPKREAVTGARLAWVHPPRATQMPPRVRGSSRCGAPALGTTATYGTGPDVGSTSTNFPSAFTPRGEGRTQDREEQLAHPHLRSSRLPHASAVSQAGIV